MRIHNSIYFTYRNLTFQNFLLLFLSYLYLFGKYNRIKVSLMIEYKIEIQSVNCFINNVQVDPERVSLVQLINRSSPPVVTMLDERSCFLWEKLRQILIFFNSFQHYSYFLLFGKHSEFETLCARSTS